MWIGKDGFVFWFGVIEDRHDPKKLGRCRVRIVGWHTEDKDLLPTEDLPWAYPIQPLTSAAISEIGDTPLGPVEGTWVFGFFRDGQNAQDPVMMGSVAGIPQNLPDSEKGFNDPNGIYPKYKDEADTNRLARNENIDETIVQTKKDNLVKGVERVDGETWDEPTTTYDAQYPYNKVKQTESGHIQEFDDTPNAERIHNYHKSGTFEEIGPDGTKVEKIVKDNYTIVLGDDNIYVQGEVNVTVDGDCSLLADNVNLKSKEGDINLNVITGDINCNIEEGSLDVDINNGDATIDASGNVAVTSNGGDIRLTTTESGDLYLNIDGNFTQQIGGNFISDIGGQAIICASDSVYIRAYDSDTQEFGKINIDSPNTVVGGLPIYSIKRAFFSKRG